MKIKNNATSSIKTPARDFIRNLFMFASALITLIVIAPFIFVALLEFDTNLFIWNNLPKIRQTVIEQCEIPDYEPYGTFDTSTYDDYDDWQYSPELKITCDRDGENWDCICEERESDQ